MSVISRGTYLAEKPAQINVGDYKVVRDNQDRLLLPTPSPAIDINTGYSTSTWEDSDDIAVGVVFSHSSIQYGVKDVTNMGAIRAFPGLRQSRSVEVLGANSQVKFFYWLEVGTENVVVHIEVDGGGVTLQGVRIVQNMLDLQEV